MIQGLIIGVVKSLVTQEVLKTVMRELINDTLIKKLIIILLEWASERTDTDVDDKIVEAMKESLKISS